MHRLLKQGVEVFVERGVHRNEMAEYKPFDPSNNGESCTLSAFEVPFSRQHCRLYVLQAGSSHVVPGE